MEGGREGGREGGGYDLGRTLITYIRSHNFMSVPTTHTYQPTQPIANLTIRYQRRPQHLSRGGAKQMRGAKRGRGICTWYTRVTV